MSVEIILWWIILLLPGPSVFEIHKYIGVYLNFQLDKLCTFYYSLITFLVPEAFFFNSQEYPFDYR